MIGPLIFAALVGCAIHRRRKRPAIRYCTNCCAAMVRPARLCQLWELFREGDGCRIRPVGF